MTREAKPAKGDYTQGPIFSKILIFALPLIATGVLQQLFNTADTVVVGRWGGESAAEREIALAGVGACGALITLILNLFFGLSAGSGVCVAHDLGARQYKNVSRLVHTSLLGAFVCGVFVMIFGIVAARPLLVLMNTDEAILGQAVPYMVAYFCGVPANIVYNYAAAILRSAGDTTRPLAFLSVAGVFNVVLNLIMVIGFQTGALGVGIATAASHWVACILILVHMMRMEGPCRLEPSKLRIHASELKRMVKIGLPAGLTGTLFSFSNTVIQSSINSFGSSAVVAGNTAAGNLENYIYMACNALYQTVLTFVGQNAGARNYERTKRSIMQCTGVIFAVGILFGWGLYLFGRPLIGIFAPDSPEVVDMGMRRAQILFTAYFLLGFMECGCGAMRGLGNSFTPMVVSLLGSCALRIVWVYTVFAAFPTLTVLYISYPISWLLTAAVHYLMLSREMKKRKQEWEKEGEGQ